MVYVTTSTKVPAACRVDFELAIDVIKLALKEGLMQDGLVQETRNSIANALELRLSCTNPSMS